MTSRAEGLAVMSADVVCRRWFPACNAFAAKLHLARLLGYCVHAQAWLLCASLRHRLRDRLRHPCTSLSIMLDSVELAIHACCTGDTALFVLAHRYGFRVLGCFHRAHGCLAHPQELWGVHSIIKGLLCLLCGCACVCSQS